MSRRPASRLLALVLVALCAAACVSIPDSSTVRRADEIGVDERKPPVSNVVLGPFPGADPSEVVQGFYQAMLAYPRTMDKARLFLTTDAATAWDPEASLTVYDDPQIVPNGRRGVAVTTTNAGSLDDRGSWSSAKPGATAATQSLQMKRENGEWRITNPAPGTFVDRDFFTDFYDRFSLYFFDPSRKVLTPDPVYLPVGDTVASSLVNDLLQGPTPDLRGAVTSAVPADTQPEVSVSVSADGKAEVPLSADIFKLSAADRQLFAVQLAWTLRQVDDVSRISISVDGSDLPIANTGTTFFADSFESYDPAGLSDERRLFALTRAGLVTVNDNAVSPVVGPLRAFPNGRSVAVQPSGQLAAIVRGNGHSIAVGPLPSVPDQGVSTWFRGTDVLRPSWDALSVLWVVDRTADGARIYAIDAKGVHRIRQAPGLDGANIVAYAVSRDGVRFAAIVDTGLERTLVVSTIDREDPQPMRWSLRAPQVISNADVRLVNLADLAWASPTSLAVLANEPGDDLQPYEVAIDGSDTEAFGGFVAGRLESIAAGPNSDALVAVGDAAGEVFVQTPELLWVRLTSDARLRSPTYPG